MEKLCALSHSPSSLRIYIILDYTFDRRLGGLLTLERQVACEVESIKTEEEDPLLHVSHAFSMTSRLNASRSCIILKI